MDGFKRIINSENLALWSPKYWKSNRLLGYLMIGQFSKVH